MPDDNDKTNSNDDDQKTTSNDENDKSTSNEEEERVERIAWIVGKLLGG